MSPTSNAVPFIPAFAAMVSPLGRVNELSIQLILIGIFTIIIHAALPPTNVSSPYLNFGNYHPEQPPLRDHVLVFGIASLALVVLITRICRSVSVFALPYPNRSPTLLPIPVFGACYPERTPNYLPSQFLLHGPGIFFFLSMYPKPR
jgi:hypothetical protein